MTNYDPELDQLRRGRENRPEPAGANWLPVDVRNATHVKIGEQIEKIASKYGIWEGGVLAKPSEGGFGVITESGRTITMWEADAYLVENQWLTKNTRTAKQITRCARTVLSKLLA